MESTYTKTLYAVLRNLKENAGRARRVGDILAELSIPDPTGQLASQIDGDLYRKGFVADTEQEGIMIIGRGERALAGYGG
ncbi:hypothetical protein ACFSC6_10710 [Rufibacter sediminis]|uniref:Uncharacterized protein n=1 Tax=Rufibacter sediminis TaxID=2762756 RepID=A0ABR6VPD3_9BACT|nr:hypothetical protein [Rufibacter sediminis]MBC3539005.1 hypothetical protein [Rufibacter sediminis]